MVFRKTEVLKFNSGFSAGDSSENISNLNGLLAAFQVRLLLR
jgi:hypothetical protein